MKYNEIYPEKKLFMEILTVTNFKQTRVLGNYRRSNFIVKDY